MQPQASILIPVYNREDLIGPCIESALSQTVSDIDVVVCDNCSTDGTWDVLQRYLRRDCRIRVFRNNVNLGPVRNWARCAMEARSPYSKLLFSDDLMQPNFLELTLPWIRNPKVGAVFTACEIGEQPGLGTVRYRFFEADGIWGPDAFLIGVVFAYDVPYSPGATLFRTDDLRKLLFFSGRGALHEGFLKTGAGPDVLLFLESERIHGHVAHVSQPVMFFRSHAGSITIGQSDQVQALYRRAISRFLLRNRPDLLQIYLSGIRFDLGGKRGKIEVESILQDIEAAFRPPDFRQYVLDMRRRVWSRLIRPFHHGLPERTFREQ